MLKAGMAEQTQSTTGDTPAGFGYALFAYVFWGFLPLYMKLLSHIPAAEVVLHRIIWSIPIAGAVLIITRRTQDIKTALTTPRMLAMGALTAFLISVNWTIYVWSIASGQTLEAALGYYINPIFSVLLGAIVLGEKLSKLQWAAVALAFCAVVVLTLEAGKLPWVAIGLFTSWGLYALCKKQLPIGPNQGFLLEVLMLTPAAIAYWIYLSATGTSNFGNDTWLLLGCGVITAVPLMFYANGAKRLRLTTIALMQYIAPTLIMLVAVFAFGEPFGQARAIAFPMIWAALVLYTYAMLKGRR